MLAVPLDDPFAQEVVSVPAKGVERWLSQSLAGVLGTRSPGDTEGVSANIAFPSPDRLVGQAIQAVEATFTNPNEDNLKARAAIVRVTYIGHEPGRVGDRVKRELPVQVLGASPQVLYWSLVHYWAVVADRDELGTTAAQKRMDDWLERYAENRGTAGLAR